jgi:hypothetical protein
MPDSCHSALTPVVIWNDIDGADVANEAAAVIDTIHMIRIIQTTYRQYERGGSEQKCHIPVFSTLSLFLGAWRWE